MMRLFNLTFLALLLSACDSDSSTTNDPATPGPDTTSMAAGQVAEEVVEATSFDSLSYFIENNAPITCSFIEQRGGRIKCPLQQLSILQKTDSYLVIRAMAYGLDANEYYLCSFSPTTGALLSYISIGQEAEGVEPNALRWESDHRFSMVDYAYDFIVDEESGAYMQGDLTDSTITEYEITPQGRIDQLPPTSIK